MIEIPRPSYFKERQLGPKKALEEELRLMETRMIAELNSLWDVFKKEDLNPDYEIIRVKDTTTIPPVVWKPPLSLNRWRIEPPDLDREAMVSPNGQPEAPETDPFEPLIIHILS